MVRLKAGNLSGLWRAMQYAPISRARYVQENRKMVFLEAFDGWTQRLVTLAVMFAAFVAVRFGGLKIWIRS